MATRDADIGDMALFNKYRNRHIHLTGNIENEAIELGSTFGGSKALLIVDHYQRGFKFEHDCRKWAKKIMTITDLYDITHDCDILLNQNIGSSDEDYKKHVPQNCQILTGVKYAMLRKEFKFFRKKMGTTKFYKNNPRRILICFGGGDPKNITKKVVNLIKRSHLKVHIDIVISRLYPHFDDLKNIIRNFPMPCELHQNPPNLINLMSKADIAIGASGAMSWERCCVGLPTIILSLADNQIRTAKRLTELGASIYIDYNRLDWTTDLLEATENLIGDSSLIKTMSEAAFRVCDGQGVDRVTSHINP